ncbi:MAG: ABC transporter substrate-binding protein [Oscillospiraceae bacterium]
MKKFISLVLALTMAVAVSGCGSKGEETPQTENTNEDAIQIGIVQIVQHPSLDTIRTSIVERLEETLEVPFEIDYKNANNDQSNLNSITQKFVGDEKDLIIAIATPSAQSAMAQTSDIPIVFSAVTSPEAAGIEGDNITGTSDRIPVEEIFTLAKQLTPNMKKVGFVYNSGEANSLAVIEEAKAYLTSQGIEFDEATITNTSELQQTAQSLAEKCDALFSPIDNTVASAMAVLADIAIEMKKPIYVGADSMVADGGLATVGIDYTVLGKETADIAVEVINGKSPSEIPYRVLEDFAVVINKETAEKIGVTVPQELLDKATLI